MDDEFGLRLGAAMTVRFYPVDATCTVCGVKLDDTRVFGLCRPHAEELSASIKARKAGPTDSNTGGGTDTNTKGGLA